MVTVKEELHRLVDAPPAADVHAARCLVEFPSGANDDPFLRAIRGAPADDEPTRSEEGRKAQERWEECWRGQAREWEEVRAERAHD